MISQETLKTLSPMYITSPEADIVLKQIEPDDAAAIFGLYAKAKEDYKNLDYTSVLYGNSLSRTSFNISESINNNRTNSKYYGIWDGGTIVGNIDLYPAIHSPTAALGYLVSREHTGNNYASRATKMLAQFAFKRLGLEKIYAHTHSTNVASARSLQKAGFKWANGDQQHWFFNQTKAELGLPIAPPLTVQERLTPIENSHQSLSRMILKGMSQVMVNNSGQSEYTIESGTAHIIIDAMDQENTRVMHLDTAEKININPGQRHQLVGEATLLEAVSKPTLAPAKAQYIY